VKASLPPTYVNTPVPIAYADAADALIVTMTRILGLCWAYDYERTPALTLDELSNLVGRPRTTLYRHLGTLEKELGWLRTDRCGRKLILRPIVEVGHQPSPTARSPAEVPANEEPRRALESAGIENPARDQLALDPAGVRAWDLWTQHPHRANLSNPAGFVARRLQSREPPPAEFLDLAALTDEERGRLAASYWTGGSGLDRKLSRLRVLYFEVYGDPRGA
jgi:hypothetical protein